MQGLHGIRAALSARYPDHLASIAPLQELYLGGSDACETDSIVTLWEARDTLSVLLLRNGICRVGDDVLAPFTEAVWPALRELRLPETGVTSQCIEKIVACQSLEVLDLTLCRGVERGWKRVLCGEALIKQTILKQGD